MTKQRKPQLNERGVLSAACVDDFSQQIYDLLLARGVERGDALRLRLSAEEALLYWRGVLGEGASCSLRTENRFGRSQLVLTAAGVRADPGDAPDDLSLSTGSMKLLDALNVSFVYGYQNGENSLCFTIARPQRHSSLAKLLFAIAAALLCGGVIRLLPADVGAFCTTVLLGPLFDTYMGILGAMAGPMMFLTVLLGIVSIGDAATLSRIGKRLLAIYLGVQLLLTILTVLAGIPYFGLTVNAGGDAQALSLQIVTLILDVIPDNILQPFLDGNSLQIVFEAAIAGLAILLMKKQLRFVTDFADDINELVTFIMRVIGAMAPIFIFICVLDMSLSGMLDKIWGASRFIGFFLVAYVLYLAAALTVFCVKMRLPPGLVVGKLSSTFLLALTTASSTASFGTIMDTCEHKLGIDPKLSKFGVPLGMVLFAPLLTLGFAAMGLFMLAECGIQPTLASVGALVVLSLLLAVAAPPVSGGTLACFTILFAQLGIPAEQIAVAIALSTIYDYLATAANVAGFQMILVLLADRENLLNRMTLRGN